MRLKAFLSTYLLFLFVLFSIVGTVSVYMTRSQMNMLKEQSISEYQRIVASLTRNIVVLYDMNDGFGTSFSIGVDSLVRGYSMYYSRYDIHISLTRSYEQMPPYSQILFVRQNDAHLIHISGGLPEPFEFFGIDYQFNFTENILELRSIQRVILTFAIGFSIITAFGLYFILLRIFKPLSIVAGTSKKIAMGNYAERINIKGESELSEMAESFNQMAGEIEKQIRILEAEAIGKQQFVDNFAHEIRSPLTSIYGYAEYIQKTPLDGSEIIDSAQTIMDEASHMKKIANSLLELATLRNYTPVKNEISISRLFEDIRQTLQKSLQNENIELVCKNEADILIGQEDLIKSLLLNLCYNAIKAIADSNESPSQICLHAIKKNNYVVISITDNGCGISAEDIAKITEPFYRVDKVRNRAQGGTGLGLTLCKQIAEAHGAKMTIESAVGIGTTIEITFTTS